MGVVQAGADESRERSVGSVGSIGEAAGARERADFGSLAFCLLGSFLLRAAAATGGTLISLYLGSLSQQGVPIRAQVVSLTAIFFYAAELLGSPAFGLLSDLRGRKLSMLLGPAFGAVAVQLIALAPTIATVLAARVFQGLSTAASMPSTLSYLSAETGYSERLRGRIMSLFEVASIGGLAGGFAAGGVLWDRLGHDGFYAVIGIYAGSAAALVLVRDRLDRRARPVRPDPGAAGAGEAAAAERPAPAGVRGLARALSGYFAFARSGAAVSLIPAWVSMNAVVGLWFSQLDFQMKKGDDPTQLLVGGFTGSQIGFYTAGLTLLFVVGIALWALTFSRLHATQVMTISLVGLFTLVVVLLLLNHTAPTERERILWLVGLLGAAILVVSGFTPAALAYLAGVAEEFAETRGSLMGLYSVFLGVGQILGSLLGGFFAEWRGVDGMIVLTAILGCVAAGCVAALVRQERSRPRGAPPSAVRLPPGVH